MTDRNVERIRVLPESVKRKIAAGEVVEGPASVVKELLENSLDAGAAQIDIQIGEGGLKRIMVRDDGRGIVRDDIALAVMEHATSKIGDIHDIEQVASYGFRGEALSSISAVSGITILSRRPDDEMGARLTGTEERVEVTDYAGPAGTTVIVENLFYNVPARKKFLKAVRTELKLIRETVLRAAIPHPRVAFTLDFDEKRQFTLSRAADTGERLRQIYGPAVLDGLYHDEIRDLKVGMSGYFSRPGFLKSSRSMQMLYVNGRPVEYRYLGFILTRAYDAMAEKGKYPAGIIFIDIDPVLVDVNIHPAKREVKLFDQRYIDQLIMGLAEKVLGQAHRVDNSLFAPGGPAPAAASAVTPDRISRQRNLPFGAVPVGGAAGSDLPHSRFVRDVAELYRDTEEGKTGRIIGTLFGTYIILEKEDQVYFIDFHAAHERLIYDALLEKGNAYESQRLAIPRVVELSIDDHALVMENIEAFAGIGFDIEDFADTSIKISALPEIARDADAMDIITDFIRSAHDEHEQGDTASRIAASVACHAAKRAGEVMTRNDMTVLTEKIFSHDGPLRCPHGRPFVYTMGKNDIERLFKRQ